MNKKQAKRRRDIKTKLMAAICMLLVSSIMMVSTTYAWFTLSTAPEVTGINTAVGANGNLEMALQPLGGVDAIAESAVGDSMDALNERNITWGNLVDLSYTLGTENYYGLDKITLNPSKLNVGEDGKLSGALLETPSYGADGRVSALLKNTVTSIYTDNGFPQATGYGVRAVGTASGMTDRQLDYRNYTGDANSAISQAKNLAKNSLNQNGASLANIAITYYMNKDAKFSSTEVGYLMAIVDDLLGVEGGKTGVIQYIENAYRYLIVAYGASQKGVTAGMDDTEYAAFKAAVMGAATVADALAELTKNSVALPDGVTEPLTKLAATRTAVTTAKTKLAALPESGIEWTQIREAMEYLVNIDQLTMVCGDVSFPVGDAMDHVADIAASISNLVLTMPTNGGVYADVADHCGNYEATVDLTLDMGAIMGGSSSGTASIQAKMKTASTVSTAYLSALSKVVADASSPAGTTGQVMPLSDFYGYVIDLAFRTNAASSNLLLQTEAAGRIYSNENSTEETMGHGASMTFTTAATGFTLEKMQNLMGAIRLVFFDTNSGEIHGYAKLDMTAENITVVGGNTITAKLYLYEKTEAGVQFFAATHVVATPAGEDTEATYKEAGEGETATHALIDGKYVAANLIADASATGGYREVEAGETATHAAKYIAAGETLITTQEDAVIMDLTQNTARALSVLVYLDGENVTNADVAIDAQSMTGTLNLQFSSSANLVPMNYTPLMNQGGNGEDGE